MLAEPPTDDQLRATFAQLLAVPPRDSSHAAEGY
jgi:hypothetical protein